MDIPTKILERKLFHDGYRTVIGIDEVGMGCLAGPVVVCAVVLTQDTPHIHGIRDSKLMTAKQRETCAKIIQKLKIKYQIAYSYPRTIDRINIYQAARKAMRRAIAKLEIKSQKSKVLVDGPHLIPKLSIPQQAIIKGDQKIFAIACASILAKVYRDNMMRRYSKKFPEYGFERHKGYGTKDHTAILARFGPTIIHRRSFTPVAAML